jgi:hypothetical protein
MLKKDRQPNCYKLAYPKNNVTNILSDPLKETTDARSVYFTHNLALLDTIRKTSEVRAARTGICLSNNSRKLPSKTAHISGLTSTNARRNLVSINQLLVNNLLPSRTTIINRDCSHSMGLYKSLYGQLNLAATQLSHCTGRCYQN